MGGLGILSDNVLAHVPGTVRLDDMNYGGAIVGMKHATGKDSHIVLAPQPSDDPNDPLVIDARLFLTTNQYTLADVG